MRWILCGKNDVAIAALEFLRERGDEVWVVATAGDDGRAGWQGSLAAASRRDPRPIAGPGGHPCVLARDLRE